MNQKLAGIFDKAMSQARGGNPSRLDRVMRIALPFNRPHKIRLLESGPAGAVVGLPSRRSNKNHLGGMHACAIATALEYCSGLTILMGEDMGGYRIIMSRIEVDYLARPEGDCRATVPDGVDAKFVAELSDLGVAKTSITAVLHDASGREVARALVHWQLKRWDLIGRK
jgi:acyl-coenzyme A thioesterase PaaI-like protein